MFLTVYRLNLWKSVAVFCIILTLGTIVHFNTGVQEDDTDIATCMASRLKGSMDDLHRKLLLSEIYWEQDYQFREKQEQEAKENGIVGKPVDMSAFWRFFPDSFSCPYNVSRVGKDEDGGKNVCGFSEIMKLSECVVYSFGINNEVSFETMILEQTNCTVRMYDIFKIRDNPAALLEKFGGNGRITYSDVGIGVDPNNSLKAIMAKNGDFFINILKMDIEGAEWTTLLKATQDFPDGLPISQLLVEIHVNYLKPSKVYPALRNWWYYLENSGLRPFSKEPNPFYPLVMWEYSFLSVKFGMFKLERPLVWGRQSEIPANMWDLYKMVAVDLF